MRTATEIRAEWLASLLSTEPADRPRTESALRDLYALADLAPPEQFFWFDSPFGAAWAVGLLSEPHDFIWQRIIADVSRRKREREYIDRVRASLCESAGQPDWTTLMATAGGPVSSSRMRFAGASATPAPVDSIHGKVALARFELYDEAMPPLDDSSDLYRAEHHFRGVMSGQSDWSIVNPLISASFYRLYSFSTMNQDEVAMSQEGAAAGGRDDRDVPRVFTAAWDVARSAGPWWPLSRAVVLSDRPTLMHLNEKHLLHRGGGPAAEYRDGARVWAWNGHAMRESWIMNPETISARDLKEFDATFREYAAARIGPSGKRAKLKPSSILKWELPANADERVALLRKHNEGKLPLFDRYVAGEYEKVWNELIALGPNVREDPHAADALAVAYETMRRVAANVIELNARLQALGYQATSTQPHLPPGPKAHKQVARLEKAAGALPLSLCAFYEVVGAVDWIGEHPSLSPRTDSVAPDPLVVFPVEEALALCEDGVESIIIASDDLHKTNISGGEPYEIEVPDLGADGKFLNERHELYFVEYLRLVFRFGGFPGYDGIDRALPPELARLSAGLIPF
jgi:uncharacterized protein DUF6745